MHIKLTPNEDSTVYYYFVNELEISKEQYNTRNLYISFTVGNNPSNRITFAIDTENEEERSKLKMSLEKLIDQIGIDEMLFIDLTKENLEKIGIF